MFVELLESVEGDQIVLVVKHFKSYPNTYTFMYIPGCQIVFESIFEGIQYQGLCSPILSLGITRPETKEKLSNYFWKICLEKIKDLQGIMVCGLAYKKQRFKSWSNVIQAKTYIYS